MAVDIRQITSDFERDHYSDLEGLRTLRLPSLIISEKVDSIVGAIMRIVG